MGNHRFKFSDMIPNAWFYKLKDMSRSSSRKKNKANSVTSQRSQPRCSNYFPSELMSISRPTAGKLYNSPIFSSRASEIPSVDSPRWSSKRRARRRRTVYYKPSSPTLVSSSVSATSTCHSPNNNNWPQPNHQTQSPDYYITSVESSSESELHDDIISSESECDDDSFTAAAAAPAPEMFNELPSNCSCRVSSSTNDIIIDMNQVTVQGNSEKLDGFETISELDIPPILTKPLKFDDDDDDDEKIIKATTELRSSSKSQSVNNGKKESIITQRDRRRLSHNNARKSSVNSSTGIRLRVNSPKLVASRKVHAASARKGVSISNKVSSRNAAGGFPEGFAVVKSSFDPERDFRDSMLEMIMENNIRASKDLEDLLACYLSLNSSEYHQLIVKAFEQIWFDMAQLKL